MTHKRSSPAGRLCGRMSTPGRYRTRVVLRGVLRQRVLSSKRAGASNSYVLEMLPYPSGEPHIGHLKVYSVGDAIAHFHRRTGHRVLHPMGYDAFGLPAENHAIKTGVHPRDSTASSIESFQRQFRRWGISIDWSRELATSEPSYYHWTQWIFLELFRAGLAYRKEAAVKWCPKEPDRARQRAGRCRRALRALWRRGRDQAAGAVVPAHHRLRRAAAGGPGGDRVARACEDDAAQLDRTLRRAPRLRSAASSSVSTIRSSLRDRTLCSARRSL